MSILPESGAGMVLEPTPIQFHIPDSQKAYYLGDLVVDWDVENVKLGERITRRRCNAVNSLELKDGFEEMRNKFADNYAFPREKIEKSLMEIADPFEPEEKQLILRSSSKYKAMRTRFEVAGDRANDLAPLEMIFPFVPPVN